MLKEPLRIAVATDRGFLLQTAVLIHSLLRHHADRPLQILLLHDRLNDQEIERLRSVAADAEMIVRDVTDSLEGVHLGRLARPAFFRLLLPGVCPPDWEHVLYLDVDMLIESPLDELWEFRYASSPAAMVREHGAPFFGSPKGPPWRALGVSPSTPYFNSGVMLCHLPVWRAEEIGPRALEVLRQFELPHGDQCALNTVLAGRITPLPPRWNVTSVIYYDHNGFGVEHGEDELDRLRAAPGILHFNLGWAGRPWDASSRHPLRGRWTQARDEVLDLVPALAPADPAPLKRRSAAASRSARHLLRRVLRSRD